MVADEKKRSINYGSVIVFFFFFCFVLIAEGVTFEKPYDDLKQIILTETDATVAESVVEASHHVEKAISGTPCDLQRWSSGSYIPKEKQNEKLSANLAGFRQRPPSTYCVKFDSFSTLLRLVKNGYYESRPFTVGGYNWTLLIYPDRYVKDGKKGYISLIARIANSSFVTDPKEVYAELKFFAYNI